MYLSNSCSNVYLGHLTTWSWSFKMALHACVTHSFTATLEIPIIRPIFCKDASFPQLPKYLRNIIMCYIDDCFLNFPETLIKTSSFSTSLFNWMMQGLSMKNWTRIYHQSCMYHHEEFIPNFCPIFDTNDKHISQWLINFKLCCTSMAVFIKVKVNISLYSKAFFYGFIFF